MTPNLADEDGVELPAKIVNEDLRRFFMPKKYAEPEPEPVSEPVPEVCLRSGQMQLMCNYLLRCGVHIACEAPSFLQVCCMTTAALCTVR